MARSSFPRFLLTFVHPDFPELGTLTKTPSQASSLLWGCHSSSLNRKLRSSLLSNSSSFTHRGVLFNIIPYES